MTALRRYTSKAEQQRFEALLAIAIAGFRAERAESTQSKTIVTNADPSHSDIDDDEFSFPSINDAYDHSPDASFELNIKELLNVSLPREIEHLTGYDRDDISIEDFRTLAPRLPISREPGEKESPLPVPSLHRSSLVSSTSSPVSSASKKGPDICYFAFGGGARWTSIICDPASRIMLRAHPLFDSPLYIEPHVSMHAFRIGDTGNGRGKGLFATRAIERGETLLREPPLLVQYKNPQGVFVASFDNITTRLFHKRAANAFDSLHDCWPVNKVSRRWGKARTNQFGVAFPFQDEVFTATFEIISRANHSCAPNVKFSWDYKTFQGLFTANKRIMPGEEITVTYSPNCSRPREVRREELQRKYNFYCTCTQCGPD